MFPVLAALFLGLPLAGVCIWKVRPLSVYMNFPPEPGMIKHAPFSPAIFTVLILFIAACLFPLVLKGLKFFYDREKAPVKKSVSRIPFWGWLGLMTGGAAWLFAWTRFEWFAVLQPYTFPFLWIGYILVVNALSLKRTGTCLLYRKRGFFLLLFPASAVFWWFFEYLNRFVLNWYYLQVDLFSPVQYIVYASVCFSTVLPAVLSTAELLQSFPFFNNAYREFVVITPKRPRTAAALLLLAASAGLFVLGVFPNYLFPLLWISPLLIITCLQVLKREPHVFSPISRGDWRRVVIFAAAALICGFFWEMWNFYSLAKWEYSIPFVHGFRIFEMPLPGYAGYLPFGLECAVVGDMVERLVYKNRLNSKRRV